MCGIAGALELGGSTRPKEERIAELERMIALIGHRGPDQAGWLACDLAAMAAVRLSIVDLAGGAQPIGDASGRWFIVFNGEVYNHVELRAELSSLGHDFETRSDTEVVLHAWIEWGEASLSRLEGGFAFAILDRVARRAFLARDRFGKRPLFWARDGGAVLFASEVKAFLARRSFSLAWDAASLASIFTKWTAAGEETAFAGVRQVPAGHVLEVSEAGVELSCWFRFPSPSDGAADAPDAALRVRALLREAVEIRLRADVEVGVLLSGGLDSTIVTALVHQARGGKLRSFSIAFEDARFDESKEQDLVARRLGLDHATLRIGRGDIAGAFEDALWHAEAPQFRTAFVPMYLLARFIRAGGLKVVLSGEGADEVFLGYDLFKETRLRDQWPTLDAAERRKRVLSLYPYLSHFTEANARALEAVFARSAAGERGPLFSHALRLENGRFAARMLKAPGADLGWLAEQVPSGVSSVRKAQWLEVHTLLQGYLLSSQGDRMMFAHGIEPRNPFLAPKVVDFAARLPEDLLLTPDGDEKHLLKRAFQDLVPPEILSRSKQPYRAPDASSFLAEEGRFLPAVEEALSEGELAKVGVVDVAQAHAFVTKLRATPREKISPREDQAFLFLLSLSMLDRQLVRGEGARRRAPVPPVTRRIEL